ncbi:MAG: hypothetical protein JSU67_00580 [Gammaproteobacteria bacterium]|nr:MAG: hypothetical protein JSU67_00580 [Gammaproteobacteria bacterium]
MSYEGQALVTHPFEDDIDVGRVILREAGEQNGNPQIAGFARQRERFFSAWTQ